MGSALPGLVSLKHAAQYSVARRTKDNDPLEPGKVLLSGLGGAAVVGSNCSLLWCHFVAGVGGRDMSQMYEGMYVRQVHDASILVTSRHDRSFRAGD